MRFTAPVVEVLDVAVSLRRERHLASVALVQRNPAGTPADARDVDRYHRAVTAFNKLSESLRIRACAAFGREHPCNDLARCPLGPGRRR